MRIVSFDQMKRGWFIGSFLPTAYKTSNCEVAYKTYNAGDCEKSHYHKIATEITFIIKGRVRMNNHSLKEGDIVVIEPKEDTNFFAMTDVKSIVVKIPGTLGDKYEGKNDSKS